MPDAKTKELKMLLAKLEPDHLTKEEFVKHFEQLVKFVMGVKEEVIAKNYENFSDIVKQLGDELEGIKSENETARSTNQKDVSVTRKEVSDKIEKLLRDLDQKEQDILDRFEEAISNFKEENETNKETTILSVLAEIPEAPTVEELTPEQIKDKLETLKKDKRLDKSAIKGLEDLIDQKTLNRAIEILDRRTQFLINRGGGSGTLTNITGYVVAGTNITITGSGTIDDPYIISSSGSPTVPTFVRESPIGVFDGVNDTFTLSQTPSASSVRLFLNGMLLAPGVDYNISGTTITFVTAPDASFSGLPFTAFYRTSDLAGIFVDAQTPTGVFDDVNDTFTLAQSAQADSLELYLNGAFLSEGDDYTITGATITFTTPPSATFSGLPFLAYYRTSSVGANYAGDETPTGTINGSNATFALAHAPVAQSSRLYLNGAFLAEGTDYTISGLTITFTTAPDAAFSGLPFKNYYRY